MADVITVPQVQPQVQPMQPVLRYLRLIPGVLMLFAIGYAGKLLEQNVGAYAKAHHWTFPNIEYVLWAILLGLVISNTVGVPEIFRNGVATYEFWLKTASCCLERGSCSVTFSNSGASASCLWPSKSPAPSPS